ncbi:MULTISPECIES: 3-deoxy-7-phosphoheptulonate synthase [Streptomyces]|uniref:Phospho-2-dehydro-3-deoxyheptonate aldolase n=2 Tax=Streptomyces TaxID=1883 RepID=A0A100Y8B8_9ACTN|nr:MULTISPECIES: 3-deoxy-7-phosphoheptulonate synthase [Streptomyces]KUH39553.1 phospho-2-dehydro-3-deoxyheptonate aldolase [Streptomyces kanasensis]UUS34118.1 3-deoxy-7-phosphoheptulonate synthase [Streptomyces changanensis]
MQEVLRDIRAREALQQPEWPDAAEAEGVRAELARRPALVRPADLKTLRGFLARVAAGEALVVQAGDCAEDFGERAPGDVARKAALLDLLAGVLRMNTAKPVVRVGRIAGQFTKPRSRPTETLNGLELPSYRGHMVNGPEPDPEVRRGDPRRVLTGYGVAREIMGHLGWRTGATGHDLIAPLVWTSHEALLLDYELPMLREDDEGRLFLGSTHWPWIGERTRRVDGAHVALLSRVGNPVACKIGPTVTPSELLALCARLDPRREPGRLTLIARMGADRVAERLPPLVAAVRSAGHPVVWLTDPMHGNTVTAPGGAKTRRVKAIAEEVAGFQGAVTAERGVCGGLHLETTPDDVTECVSRDADLGRVGDKYTSLCDPRLNPRQAVAVLSAWSS